MSNFSRLLFYAKSYRWQFLGILILGIFSSSFQPGVVLGVKPFIDGILVGKDQNLMNLMPYVVVGFTFFCGVARYIETVWADYLSERIVRKIRLQLYAVYTSLSLDHYSH